MEIKDIHILWFLRVSVTIGLIIAALLLFQELSVR